MLRLDVRDGGSIQVGRRIVARQVVQWSEGESYAHTQLVGTTYSGDMVFWDPVRSVTRESNQGRWIVAQRTGAVRWMSLPHPGGASALVTADDKIWSFGAVPSLFEQRLSVFAHHIGQSGYSSDWRVNRPSFVDERFRAALKAKGFRPQYGWSGSVVAAGSKTVLVGISARAQRMGDTGPPGGENDGLVSIDFEVSSDGRRLIGHRVNRVEMKDGIVCVFGYPEGWAPAMDGERWSLTWAPHREVGAWSTLDLEQLSTRRKLRLVDRSVRTGAAGILDLSEISGGVWYRVDTKRHIYVVLQRDTPEATPRRFRILRTGRMEKEYSYAGEAALLVFDKGGRILTHLDWTPLFFESKESWVFPVPDGSGFYRSAWSPGTLRIYFHPLPK